MKVPTKSEIGECERDYIRRDKPALGEAYKGLKARWQSGKRDTFTALHLIFLSWYAQIEPPAHTGLEADDDREELLCEALQFLRKEGYGSESLRKLLLVMNEVAPWAFDSSETAAQELAQSHSGQEIAKDDWQPLVAHYLAQTAPPSSNTLIS